MRLAVCALRFALVCGLQFAAAGGARAENLQHATANCKLQTENCYTNHAGNVVAGRVVALDLRSAVFSNQTEVVRLPLSIFPEAERRRIAADFGRPRVPAAVKRAVDGARKAMERSRKRAAKGLCPLEESEDFCARTQAALERYLDRQVELGVITPAERDAL